MSASETERRIGLPAPSEARFNRAMSTRAVRIALAAAAAAVVAAVLAGGCGSETSVLVVISGDLEPGVDADEVVIRTFFREREHSRTTHALTADAPLPQSLRVVAGEEEPAEVRLEVVARLAAEPVLVVSRAARFTAGDQVRERLCLFRACLGSADAACLAGECLEPHGEP
jgi:hypothetical protein